MPVTDSSTPALLQERADQQPDAAAFTYIHYGEDPAGLAQSLTGSQVSPSERILAEELALCGSRGDRVAILASQALEYVVAFLGALQAGFMAVPLSTPQDGVHDNRISASRSPFSAVVSDANKYACALDSAEDAMLKLRSVKRKVTWAISKSHSLRVADLVQVSPGSIPITTSGKIRRSACVERYRSDGFKRWGVLV
jgi:acyl-CoA synthetase (AMP-forming)/AMP-acid ligase II